MRAKADDQGVISITNDDKVKTVCLNIAVVDTTISPSLNKENSSLTNLERYKRKCESGSEGGSSHNYSTSVG